MNTIYRPALHKIKKALRLATGCGMLLMSMKTMAQKDELHGDATTYVSIHSAKEISGLGVASLYNSKNFWQARYNYEGLNTVSFFYGKPFNKQLKNFSVQVIPMAGFSVGNFIGFSPSLQLVAESKHFEFYSSSQVSGCVTKASESFFFNWSEALYKIKDVVKVGAAFQYTKELTLLHKNAEQGAAPDTQQIDFGPMAGVQYKKFYLSGYFFNLWSPQRHYAVSLTYNFN